MKIAIVGTGISGMGAAYLLHPEHEVTVYEKNAYIGGHSRTIEVSTPEGPIPVDTGFIVFNHRNYPHLKQLFEALNVPTQKSDMSFGVSVANGWLEHGSKGLFTQKRNLFRPRYWQMLIDIVRFNKKAVGYLEKEKEATLEECLNDLKMGTWFRQYYLQAMGAAIWSCSVQTILQFPAHTLIRFFNNHGLLTISKHPQWYTVQGGSREYVKRLTAPFSDRIRLNCGVQKVIRKANGITVHDTQGGSETYDRIIFTSHANQTLRMLDNPDEHEQKILGSFSYQNNSIIVHSDESFMPKNRNCWASWVYLSEGKNDNGKSVSLSYWMNNLQSLATKRPIIVTLNAGRRPKEELIHDEHMFSHPVFNKAAIHAQDKIPSLQGHNNCWYCGAYQGYGFHEDGLLSAVRVAQQMGMTTPWK